MRSSVIRLPLTFHDTILSPILNFSTNSVRRRAIWRETQSSLALEFASAVNDESELIDDADEDGRSWDWAGAAESAMARKISG